MQKLEERRIRYTLGPFLQAEADMEYKIRQDVIDKKEAEVMKNVPGWVVGQSTYHSGRWMPQANFDFRSDV
jgi:NADH dehydrogenase (ubiquinone) 1 alpha subcomplex subunit 13